MAGFSFAGVKEGGGGHKADLRAYVLATLITGFYLAIYFYRKGWRDWGWDGHVIAKKVPIHTW